MTLEVRIVVTGAGGLVGQHVMHALSVIPQGRPVGVVRTTRSSSTGVSDYVVADLENAAQVQGLATYAPDVIVHTAARLPRSFDDKEAASSNAAIDSHVIRLAEETGASLIYLSSTSVYANSPLPWMETAEIGALSDYAAAKRATELRLRALPSPTATIRIGSPYSAVGVDKPSVLYSFVKQAVAGQNLMVAGAGLRSQDFIHANDVAVAIRKAIDYLLQPRSTVTAELFNIGSGAPVTMASLAETVVQVCGSGRVVFTGISGGNDEYRADMNIDHAKAILGWRPAVPLETGIAQLARRLRGGNEDWLSI